MSNVIRFLESMGADAAMARMTAADYEAAIARLDADPSSREALSLRDHSKLNGLLNGRPIMMCVVAAPSDKPAEEDAPDTGEEEGGEEKKNDA
jgi:hypothetical protein